MLEHLQSGVCPGRACIWGTWQNPWAYQQYECDIISCVVTQGNNTRQEREKCEGFSKNESTRSRMATYLGLSPCKECLWQVSTGQINEHASTQDLALCVLPLEQTSPGALWGGWCWSPSWWRSCFNCKGVVFPFALRLKILPMGHEVHPSTSHQVWRLHRSLLFRERKCLFFPFG